jgi:uncharacterized membrane protein
MTFSELTSSVGSPIMGMMHLPAEQDLVANPSIEVLEASGFMVGLDAVSIIIATLIGYVGVFIMAYGCVRALYEFLMSGHSRDHKLPMIRVHLGKHLALGLEFLVGKDIVESIVHPSWDDLGKLGAIIILRTVVTIFLSRELKEVEEELKIESRQLSLEQRRARLGKKGS